MRSEVPMIEHGSSRTDRWLRVHRVRTAFWLAVAEGLLVVFHVIPWSVALVVAIALVALYFVWARERGSQTFREVAWIVALSQALLAAVPVLVAIVGAFALIVVGLIAVAAVVLLLADRG
jgi:hypothetical protein